MPRFTLLGTGENMTGRSDWAELLALKSRICSARRYTAAIRDASEDFGYAPTRVLSKVLMSQSCCFSGRAFLLIAVSGAFAGLEPTLFGNGVATISHFSQTAADCYSVERGGIELRTRLNPCLNSRFPRAIRRLSKFSSSRALIETCDLCSEDVAASANVNS